MDKVKETLNKVPLSGYIVLVIAIAIFSGLFANAGHGLNIFDFDTLNGKFGTMKSAKATFSGQGGSGHATASCLLSAWLPALCWQWDSLK